MKVAVTGGSGVVGRYTIRELIQRGSEVLNIDRRPPKDDLCKFLAVDLTDHDAVTRSLAGFDAVIHLAAHPSPFGRQPHLIYTENTVSNYNVLDASAALGIRKVCLASSVNAIGMSYSRNPFYDYLPVDEVHPGRPEDCYSVSKWCCELQADACARLHPGMTISSMRYHWVTEPEKHYAGLAAMDPNEERDRNGLWSYIDIRDVVRANVSAIEASWTGHERFFITANDTHSKLASMELVQRFKPDLPLRTPLPGHNALISNAKAKRLLRWEPEHSWRGV